MAHRWWGWGCGGIATLACCALLVSGGFFGLDNYGLDLHFRYFSTIQADARIVLIDIDDGSLEAVGDWPWTRRRHAEIVRTLDELGADHIVLDLVFSDTSPLMAARADAEFDENLDGGSGKFSHRSTIPWIDGDAELSKALEMSGRVYLAMFLRGEGDTGIPSQPGGRDNDASPVYQLRANAREAAKAFLEKVSDGRLRDFLALQLPDAAYDDLSADRAMFVKAFNWAQARVASMRYDSGVFAMLSAPPSAFDPTFPLARFAKHAREVGFVSYDRMRQGAVVREFVPAVTYQDHELYQLGFLVASNAMPESISRDSTQRSVRFSGIRLPMDATGRALINWHVARGSRDWRDSFAHIPAARLLEIEDARRAIADNKTRLGIALAKLVEARFADSPAEYARYARVVNAWLDAKKRVNAAEMDDREELAASAAVLRESLDAVERDANLWLKHSWSVWAGVEPADELEKSQRTMLGKLYAKFGNEELATDLSEKNARLKARTAKLVQELRSQIDGKICLVGHTASAQGDLVATPVHPAMPGVMVHANIVNMLLAGKVPARAPLWWNLTMLAIVGTVVTCASGARGWETGVAATVVVAGLVAAVGAAFFATKVIHLSTIPAIATALATWAVVTTWRQSTAERTRRNLTRALTQYASPAVASRIAREMDLTDLAPESATVTCFFCDLAGFTAMSEKLGPRRTRDILNPYLAETSEELVARGALVNKFIGDGVFAFFNAPILRCEDHATRACEAALSIRRDVAQLDGGEGKALAVRVGVATGEAFVGDYGSGVKLDYTCIGDTVNVGSRLERAGKALGVSILVDQATREGSGAGFVFRPMGKLRVQGRQAAVEAFELLDPAWDGHASRIASIELFTEAIHCFQCCQWDSCLVILTDLCDRDGGDVAVSVYRRAAENLKNAGASQDADGALDVGSI